MMIRKIIKGYLSICEIIHLRTGEPGSKYLNTRHNLGHWFVDKVAHAHNSIQKHKNLGFPLLNGKPKIFCPQVSLVHES